MRDILFRGKTQQGEWVLGDLLTKVNELSKQPAIVDFNGLIIPKSIKVIPETVGQYTGLQDKNGLNIFEGDIINIINNSVDDENGYFIVEHDVETARDILSGNSLVYDFDNTYTNECEIIGNIYDNPELLGAKK